MAPASSWPPSGDGRANWRPTAGMTYVNDKPTAALMGQVSFGGGRASGTNDKTGSRLALQRWLTPRFIKETFAPATDWTYPHLAL